MSGSAHIDSRKSLPAATAHSPLGWLLLALAVQHNARAHTLRTPPEPLSQWTEVWPTRPVHTQAVNRQNVGEEEAPS